MMGAGRRGAAFFCCLLFFIGFAAVHVGLDSFWRAHQHADSSPSLGGPTGTADRPPDASHGVRRNKESHDSSADVTGTARIEWNMTLRDAEPWVVPATGNGPEKSESREEPRLSEAEETEILKAMRLAPDPDLVRSRLRVDRLRFATSEVALKTLLETFDNEWSDRVQYIQALSGMFSNIGREEIQTFLESRSGRLNSEELRVLMICFPKIDLLPASFSRALAHEIPEVRRAALRRVAAEPELHEIAPGFVNDAIGLEGDSELSRKVLEAIAGPR